MGRLEKAKCVFQELNLGNSPAAQGQLDYIKMSCTVILGEIGTPAKLSSCSSESQLLAGIRVHSQQEPSFFSI